MSTKASSNLDKVIDAIKKIAMFDVNFYREMIKKFLEENKISKENIPALATLLKENNIYQYYKIDENKITFYENNNKTDDAEKICPNMCLSESPLNLENAGKLIKIIFDEKIPNVKKIGAENALEEFEKEFTKKGSYNKFQVQNYLFKKLDAKIESKFWENYIRSIVTAEYILDDNYSEKLKKAIEELENFYPNKIEKNLLEKEYPYLVKAFIKASWLVIEFCEKTKKIIDNGSNPQKQIVVNTYRGVRFGNIFLNRFKTGEQKTRRFEWLFESVVKMTEIDHKYISTPENIGELTRLYGRCAFFQDKNNHNTFGIDPNLIKAIKIKATGLLRGMMIVEEESNVVILNDDVEIKQKIATDAKELIVCDFVQNRKQGIVDEKMVMSQIN